MQFRIQFDGRALPKLALKSVTSVSDSGQVVSWRILLDLPAFAKVLGHSWSVLGAPIVWVELHHMIKRERRRVALEFPDARRMKVMSASMNKDGFLECVLTRMF